MTYSATATETYSTLDIEYVFRQFTTDLRMIAQSSTAITKAEAELYGYDIEYLAKNGFLASVDITLFDNGEEVRATSYTVNTASGELTGSRPGGSVWPRTPGGELRVIVFYTQKWEGTPVLQRPTYGKPLKYSWGPTNADTSHSTLKENGGRSFVSNAYGLERRDFTK